MPCKLPACLKKQFNPEKAVKNRQRGQGLLAFLPCPCFYPPDSAIFACLDKGRVKEQGMGETIVLAGFVLLFLWGWRRVYLHIRRKNGRPLIAHMLGLLLSLFPARFFVYAAFAIAPPAGSEPVSDTKTLLLCSLFAASIAGLYVLTRKRPFPPSALPENSSSGKSDPDQP